MKRLLVYILILGMITGIIPALCVVLMEKSLLFTVVIAVVDVVWIFKVLCD